MKEIAELTALQSKRCTHAAESSILLLEVDRRKRLIEEIGGETPSNDTLVGVRWMAMDHGTRSHVSSKLDDAMEVLTEGARNEDKTRTRGSWDMATPPRGSQPA